MRTERPLSTGAPESAAGTTWREAPEGKSAFLWWATALVAAAAVSAGDTAALIPCAAAFLCGLKRFLTARTILKTRQALTGHALAFTSRASFVKKHQPAAQAGVVWFGLGFDWTPEHAQKLYELTKIDAARLIPPRWMQRLFLLPCRVGKDPAAIGLAVIHGVGDSETDLVTSEKTLEGGTMIVGTTQAGKGILMNLLVTQAILKGDPVLILDPKNSERLRHTVTKAAKAAGREAPLIFDPAHPAVGIRLNPLASYSRPSEIAGRITAVITEEGPFKAFAWSAAHAAASLLDWLGKKVTLIAVKDALLTGFGPLLGEALEKEIPTDTLAAWTTAAQREKLTGRDERLFFLMKREEAGFADPVVNAAVAVFRHDPSHFEKITASLMPVLDMLTSGPLRAALSPEAKENPTDPRPAVTLKTVIEKKRILYVGLDALPDPQLACAVGSMLLADLASLAGERYRERKSGRVTLFVDEVSNVINRPLIEILNKGAESGIRTTCAMQTVSDLAARLGSDAAARMALGNFNNLIALRTKDRTTQEFVAETFGKTYIAGTEAALTTSSHTGPSAAFASGVTRRMASVRDDIIPRDVLGKLPNGEFFASLAGGRLVKGRAPILTD